MDSINLNNITKTFKGNVLYENVNATFEYNQLTVIIGASGSGKTTLLNIIAGIDDDYSGDVQIPNSKNTINNLRNIFSFIFQNFGLIDNESVEQNLRYVFEFENKNKKQQKREIEEALDKVGLLSKINEKVYTLSGGEKQRIAVARVFLKKSLVILADEPTGNLDEENKQKIISYFQELINEGKTIILVTHDLDFLKYADKIYKLEDKKLKIVSL